MKYGERNPEIRRETDLPLFREQSFHRFEQQATSGVRDLAVPAENRVLRESKLESRVTNSLSPDVAHARRNDPATSHAAARSVVNLGRTREGILKILRLFGPCTDEKIELMYRGLQERGELPMRRDSGIRSRRKELCDMGFVEAAGGFNEDGTTWGITGKTSAKRNCIVWKLSGGAK